MTIKATFGTTEPRDLFYPSVTIPGQPGRPEILDAGKVQDTFKRVFDMLYRINPPEGSRTTSSVLDTYKFPDTFNIKLENKRVNLSSQVFAGSTSGATWNEHTLTYNGVAYTITANDTASTNKFIYWQLDLPNNYQTSSTFPTLGTDDYLIAVFNSSDSTVYEFWNAAMAPAFISTALIEDAAITNAKIDTLSASKITTGTLAADVQITLTKSDTTPAKFIFESTAEMYVVSTGINMFLVPLSDKTSNMLIGTGAAATPKNWATISLNSKQTGGGHIIIGAHSDTSDDRASIVVAGGSDIIEFYTAGSAKVQLTGTALKPSTDNNMDLGTSANSWASANVQGTITSGHVTPNTDNTFDIGSSSFYFRNGWFKDSIRIDGQDKGVGNANQAVTFDDTNDQIDSNVNGTIRFRLDATNDTADTSAFLYFNGSLRRITVDASDLGSGAKNYLYLP